MWCVWSYSLFLVLRGRPRLFIRENPKSRAFSPWVVLKRHAAGKHLEASPLFSSWLPSTVRWVTMTRCMLSWASVIPKYVYSPLRKKLNSDNFFFFQLLLNRQQRFNPETRAFLRFNLRKVRVETLLSFQWRLEKEESCLNINVPRQRECLSKETEFCLKKKRERSSKKNDCVVRQTPTSLVCVGRRPRTRLGQVRVPLSLLHSGQNFWSILFLFQYSWTY